MNIKSYNKISNQDVRSCFFNCNSIFVPVIAHSIGQPAYGRGATRVKFKLRAFIEKSKLIFAFAGNIRCAQRRRVGKAHNITIPDNTVSNCLFREFRGLRIGIILSAVSIFLFSPHYALSQPFTESASIRLTDICQGDLTNLLPNLRSVCNGILAQGIPAQATVAGAGQFSVAQIIQERTREKELIAEVEGGRGGSGDMWAADLGHGFGAFMSAGAYSLRHDENAFEEGYDSTVPTVTVGADYRVTNRLLVGLAFNYHHWDGDFDSAGGFKADAFGPLVYVHVRPYEGVFADASLGYTRQNNSRSRRAVASGGEQRIEVVNASAPGDANSNQFWANILAGYDYPVQNFKIGPRIGLSVLSWQVNGYAEGGTSGLQLRYDDYDATSVQTSLGAAAEYPISTSFGVVTPQLTAAWVHEFGNDQQTITARFIEAPGSSPFAFQTEEPARDWAVISLGASLAMANGLRPYVKFTTIQGNENYESYGGIVGLAFAW
jgi:uncharacterized protein YhjY with autotransporter beta-barrel domain